MPISRSLFPELNFLLTTACGTVDEVMLRRHVLDLNKEAAGYKALRELVDCRQITEMKCPTVQNTVEAALLEKGQPRALGGTLVFVVSQPAVFGMARAYMVGAEGIRKRMHVTYSLNEALAWLGIDPAVIDPAAGCVPGPPPAQPS